MSNPDNVRDQIAAYRRAVTDLHARHAAAARARAEYDRAADRLADARTAADAAHAELPRERRASATLAATDAQEQAARAARDRLRQAEMALEQARLTERLEREILVTLRVLLATPEAEQ